MKRQHKLISTEQQQQQIAEHQQQQQAVAREFNSVEEMLRHDALHTPVPPAIAHRLAESLAADPPAARSSAWWRRWFKR